MFLIMGSGALVGFLGHAETGQFIPMGAGAGQGFADRADYRVGNKEAVSHYLQWYQH